MHQFNSYTKPQLVKFKKIITLIYHQQLTMHNHFHKIFRKIYQLNKILITAKIYSNFVHFSI